MRREDTEFVLVPSEWSSFPGATGDNAEAPYDRDVVAPYWSDVLITNMFAGNALIGEPIDALTKKWDDVASLLENANNAVEVVKSYRDIITEAVKYTK